MKMIRLILVPVCDEVGSDPRREALALLDEVEEILDELLTELADPFLTYRILTKVKQIYS